MRIGVNTVGIDPERGGGDAVFLRNFMQRVSILRPETQLLVFTDESNHEAFPKNDRTCVGSRARAESNVSSAAKRAGVEVLLSPLSVAPIRCAVRHVPFVLSLYGIDKAQSGWFRTDPHNSTRQILTRSSTLVVASEFLRRQLLSQFEVPINKSVVAPLGVSQEFDTPQTCIVEKPFLLFVGKTSETKNIGRLLDVFDKVRDEFPHSLVVVGPTGTAEPNDWGERVIRVDHMPAPSLAGLFQHCDAFIYPVIYDGSGLTVLEAMRAGAPIVTARTGAIPEVAGDVPMYANAESTASFYAAVKRTITEESKDRGKRIQLGRKSTTEYTWDRCVWKTLSALARVEQR
jgi:glycosyltransferase involved in cell wall biosynthesis